jgi:hypothetical protein
MVSTLGMELAELRRKTNESCQLFITWFVSCISLKCVSNESRIFYLTCEIWYMLTIFVIKGISAM